MRNINKCIFAFNIINTSSASVLQSSESAHMNSHHMYMIPLTPSNMQTHMSCYQTSSFFIQAYIQMSRSVYQTSQVFGHPSHVQMITFCIMYLTNSFCCQSCDGFFFFFRCLLYGKAKSMGIILGSFPYKHVCLRCLCLITVT